MLTSEYIRENNIRKKKFTDPYDQHTGKGSLLPRIEVRIAEFEKRDNEGKIIDLGTLWLPVPMMLNPVVNFICKNGSFYQTCIALGRKPIPENIEGICKTFIDIRLDEDFEYWAIETVKIQDKETSEMIPFKLRYAQKKLLYVLEVQHRWIGKPIRLNIDKARQWGGSTGVHVYYDWIQVRRKTGWNSIITTDVEDQARNILSMLTRIGEHYPKAYGEVILKPYERMTNTRQIMGRNCYVTVSSMQKPNASRSFAYQMAHLSEVAFWKKTEGKEPKDVIQSIRSGILYKKDTAIIQESTAKGTGNFWYNEWQASIKGESGYYPLFVGFWEIELYEEKIFDYHKFIRKMNSWEPEKRKRALWLWSLGATLESIKWYFNFMQREGYDEWRMMSEFPATWEESFQSTGSRVFPPEDVDRMRKIWACKPSFIGDITGDADTGVDALKGIKFIPNEQGCFKVWSMPDFTKRYNNRYLVSVDIGGTTKDADNSVIKVFDRLSILSGGVPEVIATWAGHLPQDMIAWLAARIATFYDNAMLVVESNSLRTEKGEGDHFLTVLNEIKEFYDNLYCRTTIDRIREGKPAQYGFHTNQQTKPMVISGLRTAFRTNGLIENDDETLVECDQYELKDNGEYGAVDGAHDDRVMALAIGLWVCMNNMDPISEVRYSTPKRINKTAGAGESRF